ncbi:DUF551 domain-containing protein [Cronobacter sakazakii]|uniref:DUF551 domain-containing protein n=2 Tax=Cronobacter sakazakii TaxID=28141 RepID=UPI0020CA15D5|nr:DUF551 domain-containing protein [Cronobacter sakazakii]
MSTISNERLEKLSEYDCADRYEVMSMATELLALRKEREKEESAVCPKCGNTGLADSGGVQPWGEPILIECDCTAPPAPSIADDSLPYDPQIAEYEQMMEAEQAQADTTAQQFESLAGKAVGRSDGFECTPVADLYELLTKCGECYDYTTSAKVAADWIKEGYSAREYVKLDRLQEAMTQGSSGGPDGWIPCSERMPVEKDIVLVVDDGYFVCEAQYREGDFFSAARGNNEFFETICRDVEFWQPLPEPPCK